MSAQNRQQIYPACLSGKRESLFLFGGKRGALLQVSVYQAFTSFQLLIISKLCLFMFFCITVAGFLTLTATADCSCFSAKPSGFFSRNGGEFYTDNFYSRIKTPDIWKLGKNRFI